MNELLINKLHNDFKRQFAAGSQLAARAPGRANIIGEHTDYNGGFVLPAAIDKNIYALGSKRDDSTFNVYSHDFQESVSFSVHNLEFDKIHSWSNYIKGVLWEFRNAGFELHGMNIVFGGDIPIGAGLSSSAALELAAAVMVKSLCDLDISDRDLIHICWNAERNFVGVQCGIMDQFISCLAKKDHAVLLNCTTLEYRYIPLKLDRYSLVLCNTLKKRELVNSAYNSRKKECEEAAAFFRNRKSDIEYLCDVPLDLYTENKNALPTTLQNRCKHVLYENNRVLECAAALEEDDIEQMGKLLYESHAGLRDFYEVSCFELDTLVEIAQSIDGCLGSRMMGAGFGGCTVNIVEKSSVGNFSETIKSEYYRAVSVYPEIYICGIEDGAFVID